MWTRGIDVSQCQRQIDWPAVAASGVAFAYIKATEGGGYVDPLYQQHTDGARAAGLLVGAYHFARPSSTPGSARAQFRAFWAALGPTMPDLPLALDLETTGDLGPRLLTTWAEEWVDECRERMAVRPVGYWGSWFSDDHMVVSPALAACDLWLPAYTRPGACSAEGSPAPRLPRGRAAWRLWQHEGDMGRCPGVTGPVDLDVFNGPPEELRAWCGLPRRIR